MDNLVVLFNKPIWFVREDNDIRTVVEVYGYIIPDQTPEQVSEQVVQGYLECERVGLDIKPYRGNL